MTGTAMDHGTVAPGFERLFEPLDIGNFTVRNRIVNTTHGTALPEARDLAYLRARAEGGAGLMGLHASHGVYEFVVAPGAETKNPDWDVKALSPTTREGIEHYDNVAIPYLEKRARIIHNAGAKCFGQVYHPGAGTHARTPHAALAPSAVVDPYEAKPPHPLTEAEIEEIIAAYAQGIRRIQEAGVDAAELHGAHGYLIHQFLSPYFNRRTDQWGGDITNRVRFPLAIISEARRHVGADFPIGIRIGLEGDGSRGLTNSGLAEIGELLAPHVAYFSVSGGNYSGFGDGFESAYVSPWYKEPGFNVPSAIAVKERVDVPVFVTGRIVDPAIAEGILRDGAADMIGMVRALIADPDLPNKVREGRSGEIRMCLGMSECHFIGPHRVPMTCAVNPAAAREDEMTIVRVTQAKTIVVVGAGPAGMEAARVAALRGHEVYLCDRRAVVGGTPLVLAQDPNRRNLRDLSAYFETQLSKLGVTLMLNTTVTPDDLAEFTPDAVIVATGGRPLVPEIEGVVDNEHVVVALDALQDIRLVRDRVLVVGGLDNQIGGPTVAEYFADNGKDVTFISEHLDFAHGAEDGTRYPLMYRLQRKGVRIEMLHKLVGVSGSDAAIINTFTRSGTDLREVTIVLACGLVADDGLAQALMGRVASVQVVGDALAPRRIMHATLEGARAALAV
jgi:2,4-dienoyl-CoA reductase-like NADH-dependent reductase (Old Yellow Enzyme family)/thioredoxin reductase